MCVKLASLLINVIVKLDISMYTDTLGITFAALVNPTRWVILARLQMKNSSKPANSVRILPYLIWPLLEKCLDPHNIRSYSY